MWFTSHQAHRTRRSLPRAKPSPTSLSNSSSKPGRRRELRFAVPTMFAGILGLALGAVAASAQEPSPAISDAAQQRLQRVGAALVAEVAGEKTQEPTILNGALDALIDAWHE